MNADEARLLVEALDAFPGALVVVDGQGHVLYANTRAAVWDSDPPRLRVGHPLPDGFPGWIDAPGAAEVRQAVADRAPMRVVEPGPRLEARLETAIVPAADGVLVWVREVAPSETPDRKDGGNEPPLSLGPEDRNRLVHDFMQPLGTIMNKAELIRAASSGEVQHHASVIASKTTEMAAAIRTHLGVVLPPKGRSADDPGPQTAS